MAKYNIAQIQKMVDRLAEIGINTEKQYYLWNLKI